MTTYKPSVHHPVAQALGSLGRLTLVGSRAVQCWPLDKIAGPDSDWDYYLDVPEPRELIPRLQEMGFVCLPSEGGPYGADDMIEGIWRLPAGPLYGQHYPHVDVILLHSEIAEWRLEVLAGLRQSERAAQIGRGIKAEKAWGTFWWLARRARQTGHSWGPRGARPWVREHTNAVWHYEGLPKDPQTMRCGKPISGAPLVAASPGAVVCEKCREVAVGLNDNTARRG
jgi:hypothetical protein